MLLAAVGQAVEAQQRTPTGVLTGRVVDQDGGRPLPGSEIVMDGSRVLAVTDADGRFRIGGVPGGTYVMRVRLVGYAERADTLRVPARALVDVFVSLSTEALELDELVVTVRSPVLARAGFYERQMQGFSGAFLDRSDIEDKNPSAVSELFRGIPGLNVAYGGLYGARVFVNQRVTFRDDGAPGCDPSVWLDGIRSTMRSFDVMRVEELEGIEVYVGGNAPGKFVDLCGTVVLWTRVPIR